MTSTHFSNGVSESVPGERRWLDELERQLSDRVSPIIIKEVRQSLKSRQFLYTYIACLLATWTWSIFGVILLLPAANYFPSGKPLLFGYFLILAVPSMLVIPLAIHRSLAGENDDDTFELLSITTLSTRQIIIGKLGSGMLQFLLIGAILGPCFVFSYLLGGLSVATVVVLLVMVGLMTIFQISMGLMLAALVRRRIGQVMLLVGQFCLSLLLTGIVIIVSIGWISGELPAIYRSLPFNLMMIGAVLAITRLFLAITVARMGHYSENRSTPIKIALVQWQFTWIAICIYLGIVEESSRFFKIGNDIAMATWCIAGAVFLGESPLLSPRVRRTLPSSVLGRVMLGWWQPGPLTGMVFCAVGLIASCVTFCTAAGWFNQRYLLTIQHLSILNTGYTLFSWGVIALLINPLRGEVREGAVVSVSILVVLAFLAAFIPFSIGGIVYWGKSVPYDLWQVTNWVFAFHEYSAGNASSTIPDIVGISGLIVFCCALPFAGRAVRTPSLMVPERILRDDEERTASDRVHSFQDAEDSTNSI